MRAIVSGQMPGVRRTRRELYLARLGAEAKLDVLQLLLVFRAAARQFAGEVSVRLFAAQVAATVGAFAGVAMQLPTNAICALRYQ